MKVKFKKLSTTAGIPSRGSEQAAGWDLYIDSIEPVPIQPHETKMIGTGIAIELPENTFGAVYPRSGLSTKQGIILANTVGIIDSDYRGEVKIALHNRTDETVILNPMERVAQLIVTPYVPVELERVEDLSDTDRGSGGFGSTGRN